MTLYIQVSESLLSPEGKPPVDVAVLERAALAALEHTGAPVHALDAEHSDALTIVLGDDCQLQELNQEFLGIDAPTDVLSFPAGETDPDSGELYLGDIIISLPRALAQAGQGGHSLEHELELLTVHGVLHLLDYDHTDLEEKAAMWAVQAEVLAALSNPLSPP